MIQIDFVPLMAICSLLRAESSDTPPLGSDNIYSDVLRILGGIGLNGQILAILRGQVAKIAIGSIFLSLGLAALPGFAGGAERASALGWESGARCTAPCD